MEKVVFRKDLAEYYYYWLYLFFKRLRESLFYLNICNRKRVRLNFVLNYYKKLKLSRKICI